MSGKPAPAINTDTREFWEACNHEMLLFQKCEDCGCRQFYPRSICRQCTSEKLTWTKAELRGTVYTFTVQHRAPTPAFREDVPYVIALIDLEDGFRMMMNVINCDVEDVCVGMPVRVVFEERGEDNQKIPQVEPL